MHERTEDDEQYEAALDRRHYRLWQRLQRDTTPIEYHDTLDLSRKAFDALKDRKEDDDEKP